MTKKIEKYGGTGVALPIGCSYGNTFILNYVDIGHVSGTSKRDVVKKLNMKVDEYNLSDKSRCVEHYLAKVDFVNYLTGQGSTKVFG